MSFKKLKEDLEAKTGQRFDFNYERLANRFGQDVVKRRQAEANYKEDYENHVDYKSLVTARNKLAEELEKESESINGSLPICSVVEALQIIKKANSNRFDIGINNLQTYFENIWRKNKNAVVNASEFLQIKDHFSRNYPKSRVASVIDKIGSEGYFSLPVRDLIDIASRIASQDDYEFECRRAHLDGNSPNQKKAREFILAVVNGEIEID
jgi:hypothetical protein